MHLDRRLPIQPHFRREQMSVAETQAECNSIACHYKCMYFLLLKCSLFAFVLLATIEHIKYSKIHNTDYFLRNVLVVFIDMAFLIFKNAYEMIFN